MSKAAIDEGNNIITSEYKRNIVDDEDILNIDCENENESEGWDNKLWVIYNMVVDCDPLLKQF